MYSNSDKELKIEEEFDNIEELSIEVEDIIMPIKPDEDVTLDTLSLYFKNISNYKHLTQEQEYELGVRIKAGDTEALKELVLANLKFVVSQANKYKNTGMPLIDIINQGNIGLLEAAKRFEPDRNVKFITYAVWWIRQAIIHGITEQSSSVRLPIKQANMLYKINVAKDRLTKELQCEPSYKEISEATGIEVTDITNIMLASKNDVSLNAPISTNDEVTYLDNLEANTNVEDEFIDKNLRESVDEIISELDEREFEIISYRFGLNGSQNKTLGEIGDKLGISRERVRQLEIKILNKLKKKALRKQLNDYLN